MKILFCIILLGLLSGSVIYTHNKTKAKTIMAGYISYLEYIKGFGNITIIHFNDGRAFIFYGFLNSPSTGAYIAIKKKWGHTFIKYQ